MYYFDHGTEAMQGGGLLWSDSTRQHIHYLLSNTQCVHTNVCSGVDVHDEPRVEWKHDVIVDAGDSLSVESPRGISLAYVIVIRLTPTSDVIPRNWFRSVVKRIWVPYKSQPNKGRLRLIISDQHTCIYAGSLTSIYFSLFWWDLKLVRKPLFYFKKSCSQVWCRYNTSSLQESYVFLYNPYLRTILVGRPLSVNHSKLVSFESELFKTG